jgi:hypothetical protein
MLHTRQTPAPGRIQDLQRNDCFKKFEDGRAALLLGAATAAEAQVQPELAKRTVLFRNFTLSAQWGRLTADVGVLRAAGGATLSVLVTGPLEGTTLHGDGWSATLNSGWVVRPAARPARRVKRVAGDPEPIRYSFSQFQMRGSCPDGRRCRNRWSCRETPRLQRSP